MKLEKAIEVLTDILTNVEPGDPPEEHDALKLSIEALKAIKCGREGLRTEFFTLLYGETE
ncbi:MAG: hypothetical protein KAS32_05065 [Candidatus Peribacteraceae bacterium]|nr:hypothetical protein [Candidatus Peribacteraceae bacterium]